MLDHDKQVTYELRILRALQHLGKATLHALRYRVRLLNREEFDPALSALMEVGLVDVLDGEYDLTPDGIAFVAILPEPPVPVAERDPVKVRPADAAKQRKLF